MIPLSLYIHFPWCIRKCPYCDFNSYQQTQALEEEQYIQALMADLAADLDQIQDRSIISIFMGGGTPSLFSPQSIEYLLNHLQKYLNLSSSIEITLEANPGTFEIEKFKDYRLAGINRLSIGIQSFDSAKLKSLGRVHQAEESLNAVHIAQTAGFKQLNLDLMFGLPQQSLKQALADLKIAIALNPPHLSWYQLTLEPQTFFARHPPPLPTEDLVAQIQEEGSQLLEQAGFKQYEISAFSQLGQQCIHNRNYWEFGDYLGIGAGAHSKISYTTGIQRIRKLKTPLSYLQAAKTQSSFIAEQTLIKPSELAFEFMLNTLRLYEPISLALFEARTGLSRECLRKALKSAYKKGLLTREGEFIQTTLLGRRFYNDLVSMFL